MEPNGYPRLSNPPNPRLTIPPVQQGSHISPSAVLSTRTMQHKSFTAMNEHSTVAGLRWNLLSLVTYINNYIKILNGLVEGLTYHLT